MIRTITLFSSFPKVKGNPVLLILLFCVSLGVCPISALPIDLTKNWLLHKGWTENIPSDTGWSSLESLPLAQGLETWTWDEKELRRITMVKPFLLSKSDFIQTEDDAFALHIPYLSNVYRVYINGKMVANGGEIQSDKITKSGYRRHILVRLSRKELREGNNEIRVHLAAEPGEELNYYQVFNDFPSQVDLYSNLQAVDEEYSTYMLLFLYFFVGVYHALLFMKRKMELYNLYFALFSVFLSIYLYFRSQGVYDLDLDPYTQTKMEYFVVFLTPTWLLMFVDQFFRNRIGKITLSYLLFTGSLALIQLFVTRAMSVTILRIWQLSVILFSVFLISYTIRAIRAKNKDAKRLLLGMLLLVGTTIWDILGASGVIPIQNLNLTRFGFLFFVLGIAAVLANRFLRVHRQVEELNANLEKMVEERTNELQKTLTRVQELKVQQDGDYFLTSLLLDPLNGPKRDPSSWIGIQSYIKQKKEFEFRGKKKEIGGDLIICDDIILNGKKYLVFVNGDAMGKSIQGAGGALVLGVVFLSFIKRTQMVLESQNKSPERWIKECFYELQTIFESFDGSMLVSVVLGLVEEESGVLYYLNAEHPWTVLYRDGIASFIEDELEIRKIGTKGIEGDIRVRIFPLEKGDILFIGSDGRDDLILEESSDGNRVINEDETKFLDVVKTADGNLKVIVEKLSELGAFSDDLTLLRLEWLGDPKRSSRETISNLTELGVFPEDVVRLLQSGDSEIAYESLSKILSKDALSNDVRTNLLREKARLALILKKYEEAMEALEEVYPFFVTDNEILLQLSYAYRKTKNIKKAIDMGERLRARDPKHIRNLINLVECYRLSRNEERAKKILVRLGVLAPDNPQYQKLRELMGT